LATTPGDDARAAARKIRPGGEPPSNARIVDDGAGARLIGALGLLARADDRDARNELLSHLHDPAPRVRRAAIGALGKLDGDDVRQALIARWDAGDAPPDERRSLAEALGKIGGDDAIARLEALTAGGDAELARRRDRGLLIAERTAKRGEASTIAIDVPPPSPVTVRLGCKPGLAELLDEELRALGIPARCLRDDAVDLELRSAWSTLFGSRLWATAAIQLPFTWAGMGTTSERDSRGASKGARIDREDRVDDPEALGAAITRAITAPPTLALLRAWTRGAIRWRLGFARGHKRSIVWRVARDVAAATELVNDPTESTWEGTVDEVAGTLALVPKRADDPRFAWRVADVPASSHPSVAAALAFVATPRAGERVWDPFCGAGLELVECAKRGAIVAGSDLDPGALDAARTNARAAGIDVTLALADARVHVAGPVAAIVTNPPLGSRVKVDAGALLVEAAPHLVAQLAPGGRLVWITPAPRRTTPILERLGLRRSRALPVDLGGVRGQLERWDRR
jgi:hypothetical protein